jgi:sec-independent protein translocase protein TatC
MAKYPNDDLFESTKMSFGEHLEELRVSLFRAVVGLVIGFAIGLFVSRHVMNWMQFPLKSALENYYIDKAIEDLRNLYPEGVTPEMEAFVRNNRLVYDETYLEAAEIRRVGAKLEAESAGAAMTTAPPNATTPPSTPPSAATTAGDKPTADKPAQDKPAQDKPAQDKPAEVKPAEAKPADSKLAEVKPADAKPGEEKPAEQKPAEENEKKVASGKSAASKPEGQAADKPNGAELAKGKDESTGREPPIPLGVSTTPGGLSIHRDPIPAPSSYLVNFRTWRPVKMEVRSLNAQEAFMIWMKAGFISGIVVASPWIFWQVWQFVAAGLYPHEKNYVYMYLPFSLLLFLAGAGMAFFFVFEPVLDFLFSFNKALNIDPDPRISEWLGFVLILPLGFGISFQLPLVMLFINRLGLVSLATYLEKWRIAILAIFVISSILTPADPISIFLMAIPLTLLYFLGMGLCKWMPRIRNPYAESSESS